MLIIQRYYIKEFLKVLTVIAAGLASVFSIIELIDKIDDFLPFRPPIEKLLLYAAYNLPRYLLYLLPMAVLLCCMFVFSQAARKEEITVIRAAGGRIRALFLPFIFLGFFLIIFGFVLGEIAVPFFSKKAYLIKDEITKKEKGFSFKEGTVWMRASDGSIVKIGIYMPGKKILKNVSIFRIKNGNLIERIEAKEGEWAAIGNAKNGWLLKDVIAYNVQSGSIVRYESLTDPALDTESLLQDKDTQKPDEMGMGELLRYTKKLEDAGFKNVKLLVDLNAKVSYPVINFFMVLLGISLPIKSKKHKGLVAVAIAIAISLVYWFSYALSLSMGYAGVLPPFVSAWLVPALFGAISVVLFIRIQE